MASATECDETTVDEVPCSRLGKPLSGALSATIQTPTLITAHGAETAEGGYLTFMISLSRPATAPITVDYATGGGTATAGTDYTAASGMLTFQPGQQTSSTGGWSRAQGPRRRFRASADLDLVQMLKSSQDLNERLTVALPSPGARS